MDASVIIAQILGMSFTILGLSMIFNKKWSASVVDEMVKSQSGLWLAGLISVMLGAALVVFNNIWTSGLPLLVTIIGWLVLLKGAWILIFPRASIAYYKKMNRANMFVWSGLIVLILGLLLLYWS